LGEIMNEIPPNLPASLSLQDQGRFAVGYYHQRQDFFTKKPSEEKGDIKIKTKPEKIRGKYKPATPPPVDAVGKRRRLKEFMDWEVRPMAESLRSKIDKSKNGEVLAINNIYSGYKIAKGNTIYLIETAAIQLACPSDDENITYQDYLVRFDELYSFFCDNLDIAKDNLRKKSK